MPDNDYPTTWADGFDLSAAVGGSPGSPDTLDDPAPTPSPSRHPGISGYELIQELGRGGTAVVYLARQVALDRRVALKMVLAGGFASDADRRRFRAEAAAVAAVQHPGIVQVYEVGACGDRPYFALEYCPGGSLAQHLADGPLPPRQAAVVLAQVARAVQAAHARGIVHRDLKPGNILFAADGTPKVTDFGLARRADLDTDTALTRTGAVMGTPSYMAPEQARGTRAVGPAADVYALGAVLYECLTGRPPFLAATALDTVLHAVHDDPVSPARLQPKVPLDLETVCLKCLQKDPGKRYPSAEAVADDLDRFLDGRPILARPVSAWERAWKAARRRPAAAVGLLASVLSLVLVVSVVLIANARLQRERDDADAAHRNADARRLEAIAARDALERERQLAHARIQRASEAVERMMTRVASEPWAARPELQNERRKVLEDAVAFFKCFVWENTADPVMRREAATAYMRVASAYLALGKYPECRESVEEAARLRRGLAAEFPHSPDHTRAWAESLGFLGRLAAIAGKYDDAGRHYESAVGLAQLALKLDPASDETKLVLAETYSALGQFVESTYNAEAVRYHARALELGKELADRPSAPYRHRLAKATALVHLGVMDLTQRLDSGYGLLEQARVLVEQLDREAAPTARAQEQFGLTRAALHLYRGDYLVRAGKLDEGVRAADAGMDGLDAILARHSRSFPLRAQKLRFLLLYADLQHQAGRRLQAKTEYERFAQLRDDLLAEFPHMTWLAKIDLVKQSHYLAIKARDGEGEGLDRAARELLDAARAQARANNQTDSHTASVIKYNWACAHAQLVQTGPEEDREWHAARSVSILNELLRDGYFGFRGMAAHFAADSDFDPLRQRSDFKQLLTQVKSQPAASTSSRALPATK